MPMPVLVSLPKPLDPYDCGLWYGMTVACVVVAEAVMAAHAFGRICSHGMTVAYVVMAEIVMAAHAFGRICCVYVRTGRSWELCQHSLSASQCLHSLNPIPRASRGTHIDASGPASR